MDKAEGQLPRPGGQVNNKNALKHGHSIGHSLLGVPVTAEYAAWNGIKARCGNPKDKGYKNYGGRGIRVCPEWHDSFEAFLRDIGPRPSEDHSIDRYPNNDGNYEPGNVRWATWSEQCRNRRTSRRITRNGETKTLREWSLVCGILEDTVAARMKKGWDSEKALTHPVRKWK